jgi:GTP-binding protein
MIDGVVLLVDAKEGVMAQTKYVLSKSLKRGLPSVVVFNKVDREASNLSKVDSDVFDLYFNLGASDKQMDFPLLYASAKQGWAVKDPSEIHNQNKENNMNVLLDTLIESIPPPQADPNGKFSMLVTQVENNPYLGKCFLGRIESGIIETAQRIKVLDEQGNVTDEGRISKIFTKRGLGQIDLDKASAGDIVLVSGVQNASVNSTICSLDVDTPLKVPFRFLTYPFQLL